MTHGLAGRNVDSGPQAFSAVIRETSGYLSHINIVYSGPALRSQGCRVLLTLYNTQDSVRLLPEALVASNDGLLLQEIGMEK